MGTYYALTYSPTGTTLKKEEIDSLLVAINESLSTYIPHSTISKFNTSKKGIEIPDSDPYFEEVYRAALTYYAETDGFFDPSIMPLVNFWGFGYQKVATDSRDRKKVDSLLQYVDMNLITLEEHGGRKYLRKQNKNIQLDFSALAKGYGINILAQYLDNKGINTYLVDIGGEAKCKGVNASGTAWKLAINKPLEKASSSELELILSISDASVATSGNYRNVYTLPDGRKVSHTINPKTGYPERSKVLSATVITKNCMDADALATCIMVLGLEKGKELLNRLPDVEGCIIYDENGDTDLEMYHTEGFGRYIVKR